MLLSRLPATELPTSAETQPAPEAPSTRVPWRGGWAAVPHTATRSTLPNNAYRVLGLLIGHMDLTTCEVHGYSAQRLATELGWSTRTVERGLATLRTSGWVSAYPDPAPYRLGWLVYVVRQEEAPLELSGEVRQEWRGRSDNTDGGVPTEVSIHSQDSDSDSLQKETPSVVGASILSEMTVTSLSSPSECRQERRRPTDKSDRPRPTKLSEPAAVIAADALTELTATEQLLLDTGFHPTTARAFSGFDYDAVQGELHKQDLLAWLPREDRDRRIGMLVMHWRRVKPEAVRQRNTELPQEMPATRYTVHEEAPALVQEDPELLGMCDEEPLDPWTERARRLRPAWTSEQQNALARALRHAPNDGAALVMAQVSLGVAQRC